MALAERMKAASLEYRPDRYCSPEASSKKGQRNSLTLSQIGKETTIPDRAEKNITLPQTESIFKDASRIERATAEDTFSVFKVF